MNSFTKIPAALARRRPVPCGVRGMQIRLRRCNRDVPFYVRRAQPSDRRPHRRGGSQGWRVAWVKRPRPQSNAFGARVHVGVRRHAIAAGRQDKRERGRRDPPQTPDPRNDGSSQAFSLSFYHPVARIPCRLRKLTFTSN